MAVELRPNEPADVIVTGGSGTAYLLNTGSNMAARLEAMYDGVSFAELMDRMRSDKPSVTLIRAYLKAALIQPAVEHDDDAGRVLDDLGGWPVLLVSLASEAPDAVAVRLRFEKNELEDKVAELRAEVALLKAAAAEPVHA